MFAECSGIHTDKFPKMFGQVALASAQIDFDRVKRSCNPNRSLNLSVLLQYRANELKPQAYRLRDSRIKAIKCVENLDLQHLAPTRLRDPYSLDTGLIFPHSC